MPHLNDDQLQSSIDKQKLKIKHKVEGINSIYSKFDLRTIEEYRAKASESLAMLPDAMDLIHSRSAKIMKDSSSDLYCFIESFISDNSIKADNIEEIAKGKIIQSLLYTANEYLKANGTQSLSHIYEWAHCLLLDVTYAVLYQAVDERDLVQREIWLASLFEFGDLPVHCDRWDSTCQELLICISIGELMVNPFLQTLHKETKCYLSPDYMQFIDWNIKNNLVSYNIAMAQNSFMDYFKSFNPYIITGTGITPLALAILKNNFASNPKFAELNFKTMVECTTAMQVHTGFFRRCDMQQVLYAMLKHPLTPKMINQPDIFGFTCLHYACATGEEWVINLLIEHGADPSIKCCISNGLYITTYGMMRLPPVVRRYIVAHIIAPFELDNDKDYYAKDEELCGAMTIPANRFKISDKELAELEQKMIKWRQEWLAENRVPDSTVAEARKTAVAPVATLDHAELCNVATVTELHITT